jgi:hypothetical protein
VVPKYLFRPKTHGCRSRYRGACLSDLKLILFTLTGLGINSIAKRGTENVSTPAGISGTVPQARATNAFIAKSPTFNALRGGTIDPLL